MKCGVKTSEFYITAASLACGVAMAFHGIGAGEIFAALSIPSVYVGGRSAVKAMEGKK